MRTAALFRTRPPTSSLRPRGGRHLFRNQNSGPLQGSYRVATRTLPWPEFVFSLWPAQPTSWAWPTQQGLPGSASRFSARTPKPVSRQPRTAQAPSMVRCAGHVDVRRVPYRLGSPLPPRRRQLEKTPRYRVAAGTKNGHCSTAGGPTRTPGGASCSPDAALPVCAAAWCVWVVVFTNVCLVQVG